MRSLLRFFSRPRKEPCLQRTEVLALASAAVEDEEWEWREPTDVSWVERASGAIEWTVRSNSHSMGSNIVVKVSDETGEVLSKHYLPR